MSEKTVEIFWDAASPYTYLASTQMAALAARTGVVLEWRPFLLGKVFEATGNRAPATIAAKGRHLFQDIHFWAKHYGVPLSMPKIFPINSVAALRAGCAANTLGKGGDYACAIMKAYWADGQDISQPEAIIAAGNAAGVDGAALMAQTQDQAVKDQLRTNTEEAVKRGAFGAPSFFVDKQMFWGNDRLVLLEDFLTGKLAA